jgi:hypothetical protein
MGKYMPDVNSPEAVIDFNDQPVLVPFNVKDRPFPHGIGQCERLADVRQTLPLRLLGNAKPPIQGRFEFGLALGRFFQLLAAYYMHGEKAVRMMPIY